MKFKVQHWQHSQIHINFKSFLAKSKLGQNELLRNTQACLHEKVLQNCLFGNAGSSSCAKLTRFRAYLLEQLNN